MNAPRLNLTAKTPIELLTQLAAIDISVPLRTEGRSTSHCEQYVAARLLATLADTGEIGFPLRVEHRERPDFALHMPLATIGMECTEAVSDEWAQIDAIRERDYPDNMIFLPMLKPGTKKFTLQERVLIARGKKAGPPWVGNMAKRQWAEAHSHFISEKTKKLRMGNYSTFQQTWLLVQDEWRVPVYGLEEKWEAAKICATLIEPFLGALSFSRIYVANSSWLIRLAPAPIEIHPVRNLWN